MAGFPDFRHIHCSTRFDRTAAQLESDMDDWMAACSMITVTEVSNDNHAATLREKGWGYHNAKKNNGADDAGIAWRKDTWSNPWRATRKLTTRTYLDPDTGERTTDYVHACSVVLKHTTSGSKILVSVARLPSGLDGAQDWSTLEQGWRARKAAYMECNVTWAAWVESSRIANNVDAIIVAGDWNLDLKANWVRDYLTSVWGENFHLTWTKFPTYGSSPGNNKIIDGSLAKHLHIQEDTILLDRVRSSDHRPYKEHLKFKEGNIVVDPTTGDTYHSPPWWGFGDYEDDEIYTLERFLAGAAGGEVL